MRCVGVSAIGQTRLDPDLAHYKAVSGVSGNVSSVGSDTLNNLMTHWAESFSKFYPNAKVQIEGKGSSTAPPALISGTAQLGPMSREMKGTEIDAFEKKYGYKPTPIRTSVDALAVFVNKDNPITCLSIAQVDAIFSKSRRQGAKDDLRTWGQLGLHRKPYGLLNVAGYFTPLLEFLDHVRLDWAGFFAFSREDGTVAAGLTGGIAETLVRERLRECSEVQEPITASARAALVGRDIEVLVDGIDDDDVMVGRTHREAPEIDGVVRLVGTGDVFARPGAVVRATVCGVEGPDLDAKVSG